MISTENKLKILKDKGVSEESIKLLAIELALISLGMPDNGLQLCIDKVCDNIITKLINLNHISQWKPPT